MSKNVFTYILHEYFFMRVYVYLCVCHLSLFAKNLSDSLSSMTYTYRNVRGRASQQQQKS